MDDLGGLLAGVAPADVRAGDVLVVAHKAVSKAEGRVLRLSEVEPGAEALALAARQDKDPRVAQAILDESVAILREGHGVVVCETHDGWICANAGVDASNTANDGELVLLPRDPDGSACSLRARVAERLGVRPAVVISDTFGRAWRLGQTDVALGVAGLVPLDDWSGRADARGRELDATAIAVADTVAAAADLARAKDSHQPAVLVRGLGRFVTDVDGPGAAALRRPREDDLFR